MAFELLSFGSAKCKPLRLNRNASLRMSQTTPTKPASQRGRKPKEATASDNCRLCGCCFKRQYGNLKLGWISSKNTFSKPERNSKTLRMLAEIIKVDLSLPLEEGNSLSVRIWSPCARKVRNCAAVFLQINNKINGSNYSTDIATNQDTFTTIKEERVKRMSKSPHCSQTRSLHVYQQSQ